MSDKWTVVEASTEYLEFRERSSLPGVFFEMPYAGQKIVLLPAKSVSAPPGRYRLRVVLECDDDFEVKASR